MSDSPNLASGSGASSATAKGDEPPTCVHCGYALAVIPDDRHCPECGRDTARTLAGNPLHMADVGWLTAMRWACLLGMISSLTMAGEVIEVLELVPPDGRHLIDGMQIAMSLAVAWLITVGEPHVREPRWVPWLRWLTRGSVAGMAAWFVVSRVLTVPPDVTMAALTLQLPIGIGFAVFLWRLIRRAGPIWLPFAFLSIIGIFVLAVPLRVGVVANVATWLQALGYIEWSTLYDVYWSIIQPAETLAAFALAAAVPLSWIMLGVLLSRLGRARNRGLAVSSAAGDEAEAGADQ